MRKKSILLICGVLMCTALVTGCNSVPKETAAVNVDIGDEEARSYDKKSKKKEEEQPAEVEVSKTVMYLDRSAGMGGFADDSSVCDLIYAAYGALSEVSTGALPEINTIKGDGIQAANSDIRTVISDKEYCGGNNSGIIENFFENAQPDAFSVLVTNLNGQLNDYVGLSRVIENNALAQNRAIAFVGIKTDKVPLFIVAVGDNRCVSDFINSFKGMEYVKTYDGEEEVVQSDDIRKINYEIFAVDNGILGIDYKNIELLENGVYYDVTKTENDDGTVSTKTEIINEVEGSFTKINTDYTKEVFLKSLEEKTDDNADNTDTSAANGNNGDVSQNSSESLDGQKDYRGKGIEGTVNFTDISKEKPLVEFDKKLTYTLEDGTEVKIPSNEVQPTYIAARSLVGADNSNLAGKLKIEVPFRVIDGVKLSHLDFDVNTDLYITNGKVFRQANDLLEDYVKVSLAKGAKNGNDPINDQVKWRVNNEKNSLICNLMFEDASAFPRSKDVVRLDITFKQHMSKEIMPKWVSDWGDKEVKNLNDLFSALYGYQSTKSETENKMTIYLAPAKQEKGKNK